MARAERELDDGGAAAALHHELQESKGPECEPHPPGPRR